MSLFTKVRFIVPLFSLISSLVAQTLYEPVKDPDTPVGIAYTRYHTRDRFDRRITFYIDGDQNERLPIVVSVSGSGAYSNFIRRADRILDAHWTERKLFAGKAHILVIEKPGVKFLEEHSNPGDAAESSTEFRREATLERWAEAVSAALRAVRRLPLSDSTRCLLIGHSEGGTVVARVAAENPFVTHVASLAGGGPTELFDSLERARAGREDLPGDPDQQVSELLTYVAAIRSDPDSIDKFYRGHAYRRWSSFWSSSTMEELQRTNARIFIAQGTADENVSVTGFDVMYATLLAKGKDVTGKRLAGADHAFMFADQPARDGWIEIFGDVRDWFFH